MNQPTHDVRRVNWFSIITECQQRPVNVSVRRWLADNGIKEKAYYYWLRKFRREACGQIQLPAFTTPTEISFTDFNVSTSVPIKRTTADTAVATIRANGITLEAFGISEKEYAAAVYVYRDILCGGNRLRGGRKDPSGFAEGCGEAGCYDRGAGREIANRCAERLLRSGSSRKVPQRNGSGHKEFDRSAYQLSGRGIPDRSIGGRHFCQQILFFEKVQKQHRHVAAPLLHPESDTEVTEPFECGKDNW